MTLLHQSLGKQLEQELVTSKAIPQNMVCVPLQWPKRGRLDLASQTQLFISSIPDYRERKKAFHSEKELFFGRREYSERARERSTGVFHILNCIFDWRFRFGIRGGPQFGLSFLVLKANTWLKNACGATTYPSMRSHKFGEGRGGRDGIVAGLELSLCVVSSSFFFLKIKLLLLRIGDSFWSLGNDPDVLFSSALDGPS